MLIEGKKLDLSNKECMSEFCKYFFRKSFGG